MTKRSFLSKVSRMQISFSDRVRVPDDVLVSHLQEESVILNLASERYFGLDDVGTRILSVLSTSDSIEAAYKLLLEEYEVDEAVLRQDLLSLIDQLATQGLIRIEGANDVQPLSEKPKHGED